MELAVKEKTKLDIDKQIKKMSESGITFDIISKEEAKSFLSNNTYYFKLKAFQKNYEKVSTGEYIALDFAYLKDFSTIDMLFRKLVLSMTLNVEHFLKVRLNNEISCRDEEDGYGIVKEFLNNEASDYLLKSIIKMKSSNYSKALVDKYLRRAIEEYLYKKENGNEDVVLDVNCPYWVLLEVLSFGDFIQLYKFYFTKYNVRETILGMLYPIKCLRNAAAHNACVLNMLKKEYHSSFISSKAVSSFMATRMRNSISADARIRYLAIPTLHDFAALCFVFSKVVTSDKVKNHTKVDAQELLERMNVNRDFYRSNTNIQKFYNFFEKTIDIL